MRTFPLPWSIRVRHAALLTGVALGLACKDDAPTTPTAAPRVVGPVAKVVVSASRQVLSPGDSVRLTAQAFDGQGLVLPTATITWASNAPAVASVNSQGLVTAIAQGATQIVATSEGQSGSIDISVSVTQLCDCTRIIDSTVTQLVQRNDSTGVYVFRVAGPQTVVVDSGSIIVGAEDGGFLRRVHRAVRAGDLITVQTTQAYLEEAVRDGEFASTSFSEGESVPIDPEAARWGPWTAAYIAPNVSLAASRCCSLNDLGFALEVGGDFKGKVDFKIKKGNILIEPRIELGGAFSGFKVQRFRVAVRGDVGLHIDEYEMKAGLEFSKDKAFRSISKKKRRVARLVKPFVFFIGAVPVVGIINKDISIEVSGAVAGSAVLTGEFHAGLGVVAGAQWVRSGGWSPITGSSSFFDATAPALQSVEGSLKAKIALVPEYSILLYGVGGPFVNLEPYAEGELTAALTLHKHLDLEAKVSLGLDANIGAKLSIMGLVDVVEAKFTIPIIRPYKLARAFSDGPLKVKTTVDGPDQPPDIAVRLRPTFQDLWEFGFGTTALVSTSGPPPFGRDLSTSSQDASAPPNDSLRLVNIRSGDAFKHRIALHKLQANCAADDSGHKEIGIRSSAFLFLSGNAESEVTFPITCIPLGALRVRGTTTGADPVSQYPLTVTRLDTVGSGKGTPPEKISVPGGTAVLDTVIGGLMPVNPANGATGRYSAALDAPRRNCAVARPTTHNVVITSGDTSLTEFRITCVALGHVTAQTQTSDPDAALPSAPVTYTALVTARDSVDRVSSPILQLSATGQAPASGLVPLYNASGASGRHDVRISSAPNRCSQVTPGIRTVTVFPGDTAFAPFIMRCVERVHVATRSTGPGTDPDGYRVLVEQSDASVDSAAIGVNATLGIAGIVPGTTTIRLDDVDPNCNAPASVTRQVSARDSILVTFTVHCPGPPAPTGLRSTLVLATRVDLAWDPAPPNRTIVRYRLYRARLPGVGPITGTLVSDTITGLAYQDHGLTPFTTYAYQVEAIDQAGLVSPRSTTHTVRTLDGTPPSAPSNLSARAASASRIDLAWSAAVDPESGIARYRVFRGGVLIDSTSATAYADVGLAANTPYTYHVIAINGQGLVGPPSNQATDTTLDNTPPSAPSGLTATAVSTSRIDLAWNAASDPESGIALYRIYRGGTLVGSSTSLSFMDTGLTPNTTYTYIVTAVNGASLEGPPSNSASATTQSVPPATGDLTVSTVTVGTNIPATGYQVQVSGTGVNLTQPIGTAGSTTFASLAAQTYSVLLSGLPANCVVDDGGNPRSVVVNSGATAATTFRVRCQ